MKLKKELIGWSIGKCHYRYRSVKTSILFYCIDFLGGMLFCLRKKNPPQNVKRIVVIQFDHIGDTLMTGYFMHNLRKFYPFTKLTLLTRQMNKQMAELLPGIDEIKYLNSPWLSRGQRASLVTLIFFVCSRFFRYDLAFDLHGEPRNILLARFLGKYTVGFGLRGLGFLLNKNVLWRREFSRHIIEIQYDLLRALGHVLKHEPISLNIPDPVKKSFKKNLDHHRSPGKCILIQMSSGNRIKEWPIEYWTHVLQSLLPYTFVVTADQDKEKISFLNKRISNPRFITLNLSIPEYIYLISQVKKVISVDTFTIHVAETYNIPVIGLYSGANLTAEWGPCSGQKKILQDTTCKHYPCGFSSCVYGYPSRCMQNLKWDSVIDQAKLK